MSAPIRRLIVLVLILGLFSWIFGQVIFQDRNFVYRDAGHFYYPLLKLVQEEWDAGRWPLWNPYENGGMPLLGNPASAVLYPPRVVLFQWLPISYAAAYKWYILAHVLLSAAAAYAMARHWKASEFAAGLAALSYAFGAIVMFQYCNVIFLVGAAWVPLGLLATDRMLSSGDLRWAIALAVVLTMQTLGGDPEAAYVTGGLAALYLIMIDVRLAVILMSALVLHAAIKLLVLGELWRGLFERGLAILMLLWCGLMAAWWWRWRPQHLRNLRKSDALRLEKRRRLCLVTAGVVAVALSAVQWIPTWEFGRLSLRAAAGLHHEPYAFWVAPWRTMEMLWPNVSGHQFPQNTRWLDTLHARDRIWEPSLYFGVIPFLLALGAWGVRRVPHWLRWLSVSLVLCVWASAGPAGGVTWYADTMTAKPASAVDGVAAATGEQQAAAENVPKRRQFRDALDTPAGGLYWLMVEALPGFGGFRYPAKLMTFALAALAMLAAVGWDRLFAKDIPLADRDEKFMVTVDPALVAVLRPADAAQGRRLRNGRVRYDRRFIRILAIAAAASTAFLLLGLVLRPWLADRFGRSPIAESAGTFGPLQAPQAAWCIVRAFASASLILGLLLSMLYGFRRRGNVEVASALALALVAADVGLANRWLVATAPQAKVDVVPRMVEILEAAEGSSGGEHAIRPGEFRVHRASIWSPLHWMEESDPFQIEKVFRWEKDTIQPKYGVPYGISYTINENTLEGYDYWFFFAPFYRTTPPELKDFLEKMERRPVPKVAYYPRRGYDMWGVKYFVLPKRLMASEEHRGFLAFLPSTEVIESSSPEDDDFQVLLNKKCYPRSWIVHRLQIRDPIRGMNRSDRQEIMEEILYQGDELWYNPELERIKQDPHVMAWIEVEPEDVGRVAVYQAARPDTTLESSKIVRYEPNRVELEAEAVARGVLVFADTFFPGWTASVDGKPQNILRTNRMMRGVTLEPGKHSVVFEYRPLSFRVGAWISLISLAGIVVAGILLQRRRGQSM